jgi:hypothetical protein
MKNHRPFFFWLFFVLVMIGAALALPSSDPVVAGLPTRPTDIPTATPESSGTPVPDDTNEGALIFLHIPSPPDDLQTIVQWQDGLGEWHDVVGWQGTLNEANFIVWWVAPRDLGAIWYRWVVYTEDGRIHTTSDAFSLPDRANQTLHILITLSEEEE